MALVKVPIYPTRNLATEIDPGARSIVAGTNVSFVVNADGSITINSSGGSGTVTSVGVTGSTGLTVGGTNPITTSGVLTFTLSANLQSWSGIAPATKANLASPVFTGDPQAPTPATADNDTSIATTAFVKNQGYATTAALGSYVLKAGDTMTGTLVNTASIGFDFRRTNNRLLIRDNGSGFVTIDCVNPTNTAFDQLRFTAFGYTFNTGGGSVDIINGGLRTFNSSQVRAYDNNNDVPVELGLGYGSATDRNAFLWNRNNGWLSLGTNNIERMRIQAGGNITMANSLFVGGIINSDSLTITGISGVQGYQFIWNTAQPGNGRTEFINNRGGGGGGFTWWDRANTGAGLGTALATLTSAGLFVNNLIQFATNASTVGQLCTHPVFGTNYATLMGAGMAGQEYALLFSRTGVDNDTYLSSVTSGQVRIRPSGNSTVGEAIFSLTGVSMAQPLTIGGGRKISRVTVSNAAPPLLIDGELYLRY